VTDAWMDGRIDARAGGLLRGGQSGGSERSVEGYVCWVVPSVGDWSVDLAGVLCFALGHHSGRIWHALRRHTHRLSQSLLIALIACIGL
jgi:hypothetical protein